jgi:hypothetical protein
VTVIFLDESGDLGFDKAGSSSYFVVTLLVCHSQEAAVHIRKAVDRTLKNKLRRGNPKSHPSELKGSKTEDEILSYFFRQLPADGFHLYAVILNKERVYGHLRTKQGRKKLYNFMAKFVIQKVDVRRWVQERVLLIVDRSKRTDEIADFNEYLATYLNGELPAETPTDIQHEDSKKEKGLQAVDVFCNAIFRKYTRGEAGLYSQFQQHLKFETIYLPEK